LDALRAATEPVKVEAMQAILMFWWGVWCGAFAGMALRSARPLFITGASRRDSANSEDFLPVRFLSYGEAVTFSRRKRLAPDVPTGTTKSRLATQNRF
jgi:hypothetical protein